MPWFTQMESVTEWPLNSQSWVASSSKCFLTQKFNLTEICLQKGVLHGRNSCKDPWREREEEVGQVSEPRPRKEYEWIFIWMFRQASSSSHEDKGRDREERSDLQAYYCFAIKVILTCWHLFPNLVSLEGLTSNGLLLPAASQAITSLGVSLLLNNIIIFLLVIVYGYTKGGT